ncbi:MAG TPA: TlyA family RNA methyltransferase [Frankiaceae bacterium]|jgi:23S rRNA (cytidine1920-2'-O)/16S rRNA (cytidine1409-2'-O)-methyltransferase|nr:TlyA family RNA methyltransferase [Frankiaceae bacterium]
MSVRVRLDRELVRRGLLPSREQALAAIAAGRVRVGGQPADKPARGVAGDELIELSDGDDPGYASRGAYKLAGAIEVFGADPSPLRVSGRRCLDAGASTGGFTDVLLREGAREVIAVDVGYGQLIWRLQNDPRVTVVDRTNVRHLSAEDIGGRVELVVADLSFISLRLVLPALVACVDPDGDLVVLVKPQFEVGREQVGRGGVVRDPQLRGAAISGVVEAAGELGFGVRGLVQSSLPGPAGNLEYMLWLAASGGPLSVELLKAAVSPVQPGHEGSEHP